MYLGRNFNKNDIIYTDDNEKANILNEFFRDQTLLDERQVSLPETKHLPPFKLDSITTTPMKLNQS